jgi:hypothetical protein
MPWKKSIKVNLGSEMETADGSPAIKKYLNEKCIES